MTPDNVLLLIEVLTLGVCGAAGLLDLLGIRDANEDARIVRERGQDSDRLAIVRGRRAREWLRLSAILGVALITALLIDPVPSDALRITIRLIHLLVVVVLFSTALSDRRVRASVNRVIRQRTNGYPEE